MCFFWHHLPTGAMSQRFDSAVEAQAAPGPWQLGHPLHQPGPARAGVFYKSNKIWCHGHVRV
jgi:hypothetical protein